MDSRNSIVREATIQDGRFAYVGEIGKAVLSPCTQVINLGGRTVVPGLIDNHNHIIALGLRPGHDTRLEHGLLRRPELAALAAESIWPPLVLGERDLGGGQLTHPRPLPPRDRVGLDR